MSVKFSVKIQETKPTELMQRSFNGMVKRSMEKAGEMWIKEFLPIHFTPKAVQRYRYAKRSDTLNAIKRRARQITNEAGVKVPMEKPPSPFVWTGEMKREVLGRSVDEFNIRTTATSNKVKAKVPVRIPHPLNPKNAGEIPRLVRDEIKAMKVVTVEALGKELNDFKKFRTSTIS